MSDSFSPFFDLNRSRQRRNLRPRGFWVLLLAAGGLLLARGFALQIFWGDEFRAQAESNRVSPTLIAAPRGIFYDRFGKQLVENVSSTDLVLDPVLLPTRDEEGYLIERLPQLVEALSPEMVREALHKTRATGRVTVLLKALDHDTVLTLEEEAGNIHGTRVVSSLVRKYALGYSLAHVLGYTSAVTTEELEKRGELVPTDITGKRGLEQVYDAAVRGTHGTALTEVNAAGRPQVDLGRQEPLSGEDISLTIDADLQEYVYGLFATRDNEPETRGAIAGAVVIEDVETGAIQALVSYPAYDPNVFSQPALSKAAPLYFEDSRKPLFNRAVEGTYPSGSIIKPFIAAAGLEEGVITPTSTVLSTGGITIGPWHFYDWKAGGHGITNVTKALAESVNTFFYLLAGGDEHTAGLGVEKITAYLRQFGWSERTDIDLPSEASGFLPTPAWKEATFQERWYIGDTYHLGIGQGNVLVTPLQVAASTGAIADGRYWRRPYVRADRESSRQDLGISASHLGTIRNGMREAVVSGSARGLSALPVALAGKTGTAQIGGTDDTHAWFTSFGPYEKPTKVVTVLLERGGAGDTDAVPLAREIWEWMIEKERL